MRSKEDIKQSIRGNLPILFGKSGVAAPKIVQEKFAALNDSVLAVLEPFLKPETIRYQSILIYSTLIFLSFSLLRIEKFKFGEGVVVVDQRLIHVYMAFMIGVAIIFIIKIYVDLGRARLARKKNLRVVDELTQWLRITISRKTIQHYFWLQIFDQIGRAYRFYDDAVDQLVPNRIGVKPTPVNVLSLEADKLRTIPELETEFTAQETHFGALTRELAEDENAVTQGTKTILASLAQRPTDDATREAAAAQLGDLYARRLENWMKARNELVDEVFSMHFVLPSETKEYQLTREVEDTMNRMLRLLRVYTAVDIILPLVFAAFGIIYVTLYAPPEPAPDSIVGTRLVARLTFCIFHLLL
jgi:hypothetical protein